VKRGNIKQVNKLINNTDFSIYQPPNHIERNVSSMKKLPIVEVVMGAVLIISIIGFYALQKGNTDN